MKACERNRGLIRYVNGYDRRVACGVGEPNREGIGGGLGSGCFPEKGHCLILYGEGANLEGESAMIFKMLGNTHSLTQCLIPGAVKLQQDCCVNFRSYKLQVALLSLGLTLHCAVISVRSFSKTAV